jgi:hypothetical protein
MARYGYQQLNKHTREIRLLTLRGDAFDSTANEIVVQSSIRTVSLNDKPPYYALSYTWGTGSLAKSLAIDKSNLPITESLHDALRHLQHLDGTQIWIDQICINQTDNDEKTCQVQMMKEIYRSAAKVIVWLGPDFDSGEMVLRQLSALGAVALLEGQKQHGNEWAFQIMFRELIQNSEKIKQRRDSIRGDLRGGRIPLHGLTNMPTDRVHSLLSTIRKSEGENASSFERCLEFVPYFAIDHEALKSLIDRPWWSRVWVLQEFSSSPNTVIMCGKAESHADHILLAFLLLMLTITMSDRPDKQGIQQPWNWGRTIKAFIAQRGQGFGFYRYEGPGSDRIPKFTVCGLLQDIMGGFRATDPRDYVFGILECCTDTGELGLEANYSKSPAGVYTETTFALLDHGWTHVLSGCDWVPSIPDLPSWVPDFSADHNVIQHHLDEYAAGGHHFRDFTYVRDLSNGSATLRAFGFQVSRIKSVLDYDTAVLNSRTIPHDRIDCLDRWWANGLSSFAMEAMKQNPIYGSLKDTEHAIVRTAIGDGTWISRISNDLFDQIRDHATGPDDLFPLKNSRTQDWDSLHTNHMYLLTTWAARVGQKHSLFLAESGHIGLATKEIIKGDHVVILLAVPTPLILRETTESRPEKPIYQRISSAYVHGIMQGEYIAGILGQEEIINII